MNDATLYSSILIVGTSAAVYAALCSSWFTIAHQGENARHRLRWCEGIATIITIAQGVAASAHLGRSAPLWIAILMSVVFVCGFEYTSAHDAQLD